MRDLARQNLRRGMAESRFAGLRDLRLWIPMRLGLVLLSPLLLISLPILWMALGRRRLSPWRGIRALIGLLVALPGTRIDVESRGRRVRIDLF
jgi:hypothetical protein